MGIFSCLCCVCSWWACVPGGSMGLLKLSQPGRNWQAWKILASLENTGKPGKYWQAWKILGAVSEAVRYWGIFCRKNNGSTAGQRWYRGMFS